ncbi:MAG: 6,7-dimethyl-8-ribityllumazine synthase [Gemmatimonadota bacterium]
MTEFQAEPRGEGRRFCLVVSRFNPMVTERLEAGARQALLRHGVRAEDIDVIRVPGAWELPQAARMAARMGYDGIVALGCVIRGETPHFDYVCRGATDGLAALARQNPIPIGFGLLTTENLPQALDRSGGTVGNKGEEAALAALELSALADQLP